MGTTTQIGFKSQSFSSIKQINYPGEKVFTFENSEFIQAKWLGSECTWMMKV